VRTPRSAQPPRGPTHLRGPAARADSALRRHKTNTQARADRFVARRVESVHQRTTRTRAVPTRQQPHDVASARCPATDLLAAVHAGLRILHWNQFVVAHLYHAFLQLPFSGGLLLRLPEFILPPPHPSVKESDPRGADSYDQLLAYFSSVSMRAPLCDTSSLAVRLEVSIFGGLYIWRDLFGGLLAVCVRSTDRRNYSVNRYCPTVVSFK
jgi:hypothetical protein